MTKKIQHAGLDALENALMVSKFGPPFKVRDLTSEELDKLYALKDEFWAAFGDLCDATLAKLPEDLHPHMESLMQEASSVYGRKSK